jgi:hypothetical protein
MCVSRTACYGKFKKIRVLETGAVTLLYASVSESCADRSGEGKVWEPPAFIFGVSGVRGRGEDIENIVCLCVCASVSRLPIFLLWPFDARDSMVFGKEEGAHMGVAMQQSREGMLLKHGEDKV